MKTAYLRYGLGFEVLVASLLLSGCQQEAGKEKVTGLPSPPKVTSTTTGPKEAKPLDPAAAWVKPPPSPSLDIQNRKPDVVLDPPTLFKEFKADKAALQSKYSGKVIELNGKLLYVFCETFLSHENYNLMNQVEEGNIDKIVVCHAQDKSAWEKMGIGQEVKLKGEYDPAGGYSGPVLKDCVIVHAGPATQLQYDAMQLAQDYAADRDQTLKKCDRRTLVVTGVMQQTGKDGITHFIDLQGTKEVVIHCEFADKKEMGAVTPKPGDKLRILGQFGFAPTQEVGQVRLIFSYVLR